MSCIPAYVDLAAKVASSPRGSWFRLGAYKNRRTACTIRSMIARGKGLKAFELYKPGEFEAITRDNEVWIRRAGSGRR